MNVYSPTIAAATGMAIVLVDTNADKLRATADEIADRVGSNNVLASTLDVADAEACPFQRVRGVGPLPCLAHRVQQARPELGLLAENADHFQ